MPHPTPSPAISRWLWPTVRTASASTLASPGSDLAPARATVPVVTGTSLRFEIGKQFSELGRWFDSQFGLQQDAVSLELTERLRRVALGDVHPYEGGVGGLPERFRATAAKAAAAASGKRSPGQPGRDCFEGMYAQLTPVLGRDHGPVVVPPRQEIVRECQDRGGVNVDPGLCGVLVYQSSRQRPRAVQIHHDAFCQPQVGCGHPHGAPNGALEAADGRSHAGASAMSRRVGPKRFRHLTARHRPVVHGQECQESLRAGREAQHDLTADGEDEPSEKNQFANVRRLATSSMAQPVPEL